MDLHSGMLRGRNVAGFIAPTWTRTAAGVWINSPTLGSELAVNGTFDSDLSGWSLTPASGTIAWDAGTCKFTKVANENAYISQAVTTVNGAWYELQATVANAAEAGNSMLVGSTEGGYNFGITEYFQNGTVKLCFRALGTTTWITCRDGQSGPGKVSNWDNVTFKQFSLPTLFAARPVAQQATIAANLTVTTYGKEGVFARMDDPLNPLNYLNAYHNRTNLYLEMVVGGAAPTVLINTAATYAAERTIQLQWVNSTTVQVLYGGAQVGANQDVTAVGAGAWGGVFSTGLGSISGVTIS